MEMKTEWHEISVLLPLIIILDNFFSKEKKNIKKKQKQANHFVVLLLLLYISSLVRNVFSTNNVTQFVKEVSVIFGYSIEFKYKYTILLLLPFILRVFYLSVI